MTKGVEGPPKNIEELVGGMEQRRIFRSLHELGDEGVALVLEAAAIRAGDFLAEKAARDLRQHLMDGGAAATFLEKYPGHRQVNFNGLNLDSTLAKVTGASLLLGSSGSVESAPRRALPRAAGVDRPRLQLSPADQTKAGELFEKYPGVTALFSEQDRWIEDGHGKVIERKQIEALLVSKNNGSQISDSYRSVKMNDLWGGWKTSSPDAGRKIKGRGKRIFLTEPEAIGFLWFIHRHILSTTSPNRGVTFGPFPPESQSSKKK